MSDDPDELPFETDGNEIADSDDIVDYVEFGARLHDSTEVKISFNERDGDIWCELSVAENLSHWLDQLFGE
ncbi:MAG: hypothetical protein ABEN55_20825 [Bradymonadaceae bacterium]